jgi:hypothetical protein
MLEDRKLSANKKAYRAPVLRVYGNIQSLTGTVADTMHGIDGGVGKFSKTA